MSGPGDKRPNRPPPVPAVRKAPLPPAPGQPLWTPPARFVQPKVAGPQGRAVPPPPIPPVFPAPQPRMVQARMRAEPPPTAVRAAAPVPPPPFSPLKALPGSVARTGVQPKPAPAVAKAGFAARVSGPPVVQAMFSFSFKNDMVSSVSVKSSSRSGGNLRTGAGDHTTSYVTFTDAVRNQTIGMSIEDARDNLYSMVEEMSDFPGMQKKSAKYLVDYKDTLLSQIEDAETAKEFSQVGKEIVGFRNKIPLSAFKHYKSTGGHGESGNAALLRECEDRLRKNEALRYTADQIAESFWQLLDYVPGNGEDDEQIINILQQHCGSMKLSYGRVFREFDYAIYQRIANQFNAAFGSRFTGKDKNTRLQKLFSDFDIMWQAL